VPGPAFLVFPGATPELVREHAPPGAFLVAVDAGAEALRALDRPPAVLVGDLDSVTAETLAWAERRGARVERHPPQKDLTDGELALRLVASHDEIVFLGSGGGRADHALANLHLLARAARTSRARAEDADARYWVATPDRPLELHLPAGATVSALPLGGPVTGITYDALAYPLTDATLEPGDTRGISNLAGPPPQRVQVRTGTLLVIAPRG
jgi:thiamine pyrophosphokinase